MPRQSLLHPTPGQMVPLPLPGALSHCLILFSSSAREGHCPCTGAPRMAVITAAKCSSFVCFPWEPLEYPLRFFVCNSQQM